MSHDRSDAKRPDRRHPSRLARSAPPLRDCGLDRLSSARQGLSKRSWLKVSGVAPIAKASPLSVPWRRNRSFRLRAFRATLAQCHVLAHRAATAPNAVCCPTIFTSSRAHGRALADRSNMMLRPGPSPTIGPSVCRLRTPNSTCSKRGSAICLMSCSGRANDLRRQSL